MADRYSSFHQLAKAKQEGVHWRVSCSDRDSEILIAAPHGGRAEPHTGAIAKAIAGSKHSLYVFEALAPGLHITSHRFTEPRALTQARAHATVVTVHGCDNDRSPSTDVFVGGLGRELRDGVIAQLRKAGFSAAVDTYTPGRAQDNLCNLGSSAGGVQLEITRRLRNRLCVGDAPDGRLQAFARSIRRALKSGAQVPRARS